MGFRHGARVKHTSTTTGPGTLSLIAPAAQFQGFNSVFGVGPVRVLYCVSGTSYWELGFGTFDNSGPSLSRDSVIASSAGGSLVSLPAATHDVFAWEPALWPAQVITGSTALALADLFGFILFTGSAAASLSLPAIAGVPAGVAFPVVNLGTAPLTIDPNGGETINGAATLILLPGEAAWILVRDGASAQWLAMVAAQRRKRNAQTGTAYTVLSGDVGSHITQANASASAYTLPQAGPSFPDGWFAFFENTGAGEQTITPAVSTINGGTALVLRQSEWALVTSDGANYRALTTGRITGQASAREIGTRGVPQNLQNAAYTFALSDAGGQVFHDEVTARTWTIPANASVPFPVGTAITLVNNAGAGDITLAITSDTLRRGDGVAGTGSRTIKASSVATILKTKATEWLITGSFV